MAISSLWEKETREKNDGRNSQELKNKESNISINDTRRSRVSREKIKETYSDPVYEKLPGTKVINGKTYESMNPDHLKISDEKITNNYVESLISDDKGKQSVQDNQAIENLLSRSEADQKLVDMQRWITDFDQNSEAIKVTEENSKSSKTGFLNSLKSAYQNLRSRLFRTPVKA